MHYEIPTEVAYEAGAFVVWCPCGTGTRVDVRRMVKKGPGRVCAGALVPLSLAHCVGCDAGFGLHEEAWRDLWWSAFDAGEEAFSPTALAALTRTGRSWWRATA